MRFSLLFLVLCAAILFVECAKPKLGLPIKGLPSPPSKPSSPKIGQPGSPSKLATPKPNCKLGFCKPSGPGLLPSDNRKPVHKPGAPNHPLKPPTGGKRRNKRFLPILGGVARIGAKVGAKIGAKIGTEKAKQKHQQKKQAQKRPTQRPRQG